MSGKLKISNVKRLMGGRGSVVESLSLKWIVKDSIPAPKVTFWVKDLHLETTLPKESNFLNVSNFERWSLQAEHL